MLSFKNLVLTQSARGKLCHKSCFDLEKKKDCAHVFFLLNKHTLF